MKTLYLAVLLLATTPLFAQTDQEQVKQVIETETRAYHEANQDLLKAQWADVSYVERLQSNLQPLLGAPYAKGEKLRQFHQAYGKTAKPTGNTPRLSDYEAHIAGNTAWATYTQETVNAAGTVVDRERSVRILERGSGGWKIVFIGLEAIK